MKYTGKIFAVLVFAVLLTAFGCKDEEKPVPTSTSIPADSLTALEKSDLLFLREEEKLARDVYIYAYTKYAHHMFDNISKSEQQHMDEVLKLLNKYGLPDPALPDTGKFSNQELQKLYDQLITLVDSSQTHAFRAGATIEDVDIRDIKLFKNNTTKSDLLAVYDFLECGSRNHMRAFTKQLSNAGATYTPQFISQTEYDTIINSPKEICVAP